jgi:shikimate dehydrogenase
VRDESADIGAHTGLLGIFGHPVRHTLSPRIHNAALRQQGLDFVYVAFDVLPQDLPAAIIGMRALGMRGINLTMPHKQTVIELLDDVDPIAGKVGAVNTVVNEAGRLTGSNTDISGFAASLRTVSPNGAGGLDCLVLGAGGAARAAVAALVADGAASVCLHNRTIAKAEGLCAAAASWGTIPCRVVPAGELLATVASADLIVNATSVGLEGSVKELLFPVDTVHSGQVVVDLVYGKETTALVKAARRRGAAAIDGREMLLMQAALAYKAWTGRDAPMDAMRGSIDNGER